MQSALEVIVTWAQHWDMQMSASKTKAIIFTHKRKYTPYHSYSEVAIEYVKSHTFLGLTFDSKLSWRTHISEVGDRCQEDLRLLAVVASKG